MLKSLRCIMGFILMLVILIGLQLNCVAQPLTIAFGDALPPWVIPETESGILIDLLKETLEPAGYRLSFVYVPYARRLLMYKHGDVDGVCDINPQIVTNSNLEGHLSVMAYAYENIGVSLKKKGYHFSTVHDLVHHSVVAWQGAKATIGGDYADMAEKNPDYREFSNQQLQIRLLYAGRADVIQLDRQIFKYFRKVEAEEGYVDASQPVDIFPLFGKNECGFLFRNKQAQETFDTRFEQLQVSGRYDEIFAKYTQSP